MMPDYMNCLRNADWPVIVVNGSGTILQANEAASRTMAARITEHSTHLRAVWAPSNPISPEAFADHLGRKHSFVVALEIMEKRGETGRFTAYVSTFTQSEEKLHVIQFMSERPPMDHTTDNVF